MLSAAGRDGHTAGQKPGRSIVDGGASLLGIVFRCIESVGLDAVRDKYPAQLSGGMQQRRAIAQTLIRRPKLLLLDEPFGELDPGTKQLMYELTTRLWREEQITVFMVSHDLKEAFTLATRVLTFDKVRIDPDAPGRYGATITFDLPVTKKVAFTQAG